MVVGLIAFLCRQFSITDQNNDGKITVDELPMIEQFSAAGQTVRDGGGFDEFGISSCSQTLFDSFSAAAGWGGMVVVTNNCLIAPHASVEWGWIWNILAVYLIVNFMCVFASYGIHLCTSHPVHFVYYGCAFAMCAIMLTTHRQFCGFQLSSGCWSCIPGPSI